MERLSLLKSWILSPDYEFEKCINKYKRKLQNQEVHLS